MAFPFKLLLRTCGKLAFGCVLKDFLFFSSTNCVQICVHVYSCEQLVPLADHCQKSWVNWCLLLGMAEQNGRKINLCKNTIANCGNIGYVVLNQASLRRQHIIHSA